MAQAQPQSQLPAPIRYPECASPLFFDMFQQEYVRDRSNSNAQALDELTHLIELRPLLFSILHKEQKAIPPRDGLFAIGADCQWNY
jgi:hypothetical protein